MILLASGGAGGSPSFDPSLRVEAVAIMDSSTYCRELPRLQRELDAYRVRIPYNRGGRRGSGMSSHAPLELQHADA